MYTAEDFEQGQVIAIYAYTIGEPPGLINVRIEDIYDTWMDGYIDDIDCERDGETLNISYDDVAKIY